MHFSARLGRLPNLVRLITLSAGLGVVAPWLSGAIGVIRNAPVANPDAPLPALIDLDLPSPTLVFTLGPRFSFPAATDSGDFAKIATPYGDIYIEFLTADAPKTVANFKSYLATDSTPAADRLKNYDDTFVHRSVPGFVIQAGGYKLDAPLTLKAIVKKAAVTNEFKVANTRGTLAMAKLDNQPNSATDEWFISLADNRSNLDVQNGGFTAFARVLGDGMAIADRIAALPVSDVDGSGGSVFNATPLIGYKGGALVKTHFVNLPTLRSVPASSVPAAARTLPLAYSIVGNTDPRSATATIDAAGVLTVRQGKVPGQTRITLRVQAVGGHYLDVPMDVVRDGPPTIPAQLPGVSTKAFGVVATLSASTNVWPVGSIRWQHKPVGAATWSDIAESDPLFTGETTTDLKIALNDAVTPAATLAALQGSQFQFILTNSLGTITGKPTKLKITTLPVGFTAQPASQTLNLGATATFSVTASAVAANTPLAYRWERLPAGSGTAVPLVNSTTESPTPFSGVTTRTLTVKLDTLGLDGSRFRCVISNALKDAPPPVAATGTAVSEAASLRIVAVRRTLVTAESGTLYGLTPGTGISFAAKGLPAGLTLDPLTGVLSGTPTAKPGIYAATVTTTGPGGATSQTYQIEILGLSGNNVGGFEALLSPADLSTPPVARLAFTIAANGALTGTVTTTTEKAPLAIRGEVVRSTAGTLALKSSIVIPIPGASAGRAYLLTDLALAANGAFSVKLKTRETSASTPVDFGSALYIEDTKNADYPGNHGVRLATYSAASPAPWANVATYTLAFTSPTLPEGVVDTRPIPAGSGYGLATVAADGQLPFKGKLADGTKFTATLAGGIDKSFRLFLRPYSAAPGAYVSAELPLTIPNIFFPRHSIRGNDGQDAYWAKPALPKSENYRAGFGPLGLTMRLEPWYPESYTDFGFAETSDTSKGKTDLLVSGVDLGASAGALPTVLSLTYGTATFIDFTPPDTTNFTGKLDTRTGFFSGSFVLTDPVPGSSPVRNTTRKATFEGTLLMPEKLEGGTVTAEGFVLVPALPGAPVSTPISARIRFKNPATTP